ncbi:MAG TPA: hypothetical protein VLD67_20755 [Vicinamibacterales bacterium]|nr:hypothetical protein [Vicinamibacterales bacterium]
MIRILLLLLAGMVSAQAPSERRLSFSEKGWELRGERTAIVKDGARDVLQVETGLAYRRDVRFENGTIDFDVQVTRRRSFVYVHFRVAADGEREEFYVRPHKSGLPDAVQYAPVWQGRSAWQLHHGPGGTAAIPFEPGSWMHVRVVVQGRHAALFVEDMMKPALIVPNLAREPRAGYIGFGGFLPTDVPGRGPIARFANVVVRPDAAPFDFAAALAGGSSRVPPQEPAGTIVRAWALSKSFVPKDSQMPALPPAELTREFQRLETGPDGLLELHRHVPVPEGSVVTAAVARVHVRAARAGLYALDLGFSDIATVFLNGQPLFRSDASYSFDRPRREGLIGYDQARLYLPLAAGDNDLSIVISDSFGGWGIMGRFVGGEGLQIEAK